MVEQPGSVDALDIVRRVFGDATVVATRRVERLERVGSARHLVRLLDGPHRGLELVVPSAWLDNTLVDPAGEGGYATDLPPPPDAAAHRRAECLLSSLLTPSQRWDRSTTGTFWVHTELGWFRLGALYDLRYRSARRLWVERSVCVVSEDYDQRPSADLWAELVVVLRADPTRVVEVANWNGEDAPRPAGTDRAAMTRWLGEIRAEHRRRRQAGEVLHAAYLAYDTAQRLRAVGRRRWAIPFARTAAEAVDAWCDRWPDEADELRHHHRSLLALPGTLAGPVR